MKDDSWPGLFISFEGIDGAGKSTQIAALAERIRQLGIEVEEFAPSDTKLGEMAKHILLSRPTNVYLDSWAEALLFIASRAQLLNEKILPALQDSKVVIVDRWMDSTLAYQGGGRKLSMELLGKLHQEVCGAIWPNLTIYLDISWQISAQRQKAAQLSLDRFETESTDFQIGVEAVFRQIIATEPTRVKLVDASKPFEKVSDEVWQIVDLHLLKAVR